MELCLVQMLARNTGPESLKVLLDMIPALGKDKDEWKQRCAADVVSGILFGLKLWDERLIEELWLKLRPIMNDCLDNVTQETIGYWSEAMSIPSVSAIFVCFRFIIKIKSNNFYFCNSNSVTVIQI